MGSLCVPLSPYGIQCLLMGHGVSLCVPMSPLWVAMFLYGVSYGSQQGPYVSRWI